MCCLFPAGALSVALYAFAGTRVSYSAGKDIMIAKDSLNSITHDSESKHSPESICGFHAFSKRWPKACIRLPKRPT